MPDDPYAVLGVAADASAQEIAEAYRALAQIYHPDRYADAPARVQAEANTRMQALNAAFARARQGAPRAASDVRPPAAKAQRPSPRSRPAPSRPAFVHYVDGAKGYHNGDVAPLGFAPVGDEVQPAAGAQRCSKLDAELRQWFELQRSNASLAAQQMYRTWTDEDQARYAAKLGCTQVVKDDARKLGIACGECRP